MEDQSMVRDELQRMLSENGYRSETALEFKQLNKQVQAINPNLVLLDLNLPYESGFQICRDIKKESQIPVLVLTSRDTEEDEVLTLDLGADDFISKPFRKEVLLARIRALLRRSSGKKHILNCGWFFLDPEIFTITIEEKSAVFPANEGRILSLLAEKQGKVVTKKDICLCLWDSDEFIDANILHVNITRLRQHLSDLNIKNVIKTIRGVGYMLQEYNNESN
nr:response regulator transcription factor [Clostridium sp. KNHs214]